MANLNIKDANSSESVLTTENIKKNDLIDSKQLVNLLNYMNFTNDTLISVFNHKKYKHSLSIDIVPKACLGEDLVCQWADSDFLFADMDNYQLSEIFIDDGIRTTVISPESIKFISDGFSVNLSSHGSMKPARSIQRHKVKLISVQLIQNGVLYRGKLINFTPESFNIEIDRGVSGSEKRFNPEVPVTVTLIGENQIRYSGECSIIRINKKKDSLKAILKPLNNQIQRFQAKEYRAYRQRLVPSPSIVFIHPLTGKRVDLPVIDLSATGFSVAENQQVSVLLPGMTITEAEIVFTTGMKLKCSVQVLFRKEVEENGKVSILDGFAILNMSPFDHAQLLSIVFQAKHKNIYLNKDLDVDALWRFLFETGFIYPEKYNHLKNYREEIKATYKRLYLNTPDIARHITYQDKGEILGHVSILRTYENCWLMHHHAALGNKNKAAGLMVMDQLGYYAYTANKVESSHLDFLLGYYRPENKFPSRIFGGVVESVNNPKGCSIDDFAFYQFHGSSETILDDLGDYTLVESSYDDLVILEGHYEDISGGLMLEAMDILPDNRGSASVKKAYQRANFKREIKLYSLKQGSHLLAVFVADISDTGINMSELTNSIKVLIIDDENISKNLLELALNEVTKIDYNNSAHVLLFPVSFADRNSINYDKTYRMWIYNIDHSDAYFKYFSKLMRFVK